MYSSSSESDIPIAQRVKLETDATKVRNSIDANVNSKLIRRFLLLFSVDILNLFLFISQVLRERICWSCHKKISDYEKFAKCSQCVLRFHMNCVTDINREKPEWNCSECQQMPKEPEDFW